MLSSTYLSCNYI